MTRGRKLKTEIVRHSLNETIVKKMLSIGASTTEIAHYYGTTLIDVRKYIKDVIRQ